MTPRSSVKPPVVVGIAGGSGSGKTTLVRKLQDELLHARPVVLSHDSYYRDLSHLAPAERDRHNFDHPDSLETELLAEHIVRLKEGQHAPVPQYDFATHTRRNEPLKVEPSDLILVEGILLFTSDSLRGLLDVRIFVDAPSKLRLDRRIVRDQSERQRSRDSVIRQWNESVDVMHTHYVEPTRQHADIVIPSHAPNAIAVDMLVQYLAASVFGKDSPSEDASNPGTSMADQSRSRPKT